MKHLSRFWILMLCIFAATTCYAMGFSSGIAAFIGLGLLFEVLFWGLLLLKIMVQTDKSTPKIPTITNTV